MATVIYPSPIFGPVHSRRLGVSLGINLLPEDGKWCTFDCVYCECGFNKDFRPKKPLPTREEVRTALEERLKGMSSNGPVPDVLRIWPQPGICMIPWLLIRIIAPAWLPI